jgi:hypothetical protein
MLLGPMGSVSQGSVHRMLGSREVSVVLDTLLVPGVCLRHWD